MEEPEIVVLSSSEDEFVETEAKFNHNVRKNIIKMFYLFRKVQKQEIMLK